MAAWTRRCGGRPGGRDGRLNARIGNQRYLVAEADESDRSFLKLSPIIAVVTNIDREHMDCYRDLRDVEQTFIAFMDLVPFYGIIVACADDETSATASPGAPPRAHLRNAARAPTSASRIDIFAPGDVTPFAEQLPCSLPGRRPGEFRLRVPARTTC